MPGEINRYRRKLSGPILDRIDLHVEVPEVELKKLTGEVAEGEKSYSVRKRIEKARKYQAKRLKGTTLVTNGEMNSRQVRDYCPLTPQCKSLLTSATAQMGLTARSYFKVIKISRTIADLEGEEEIKMSHLAEALQYRPQEEIV